MHFKLFYGWYIVGAALLVAAYFSAMFTYGWTAFIDPIRKDLGWSMTTLALASTLRGIETGVFNPVWGRAVDKLSPKNLMLFGVITTGIGILIISLSRNPFLNPVLTYYIGFLVMGIGSSLATGMLPTAIIARWFRKDLGKANGIFYMGVGIGGVLIPVVIWLVDTFGWHNTLMFSSLGFIVVGVPLSFVMRKRPEDYGLVPDGRIVTVDPRKKAVRDNNFSTAVKKVLRMRVFWQLNVVILFQSAVLGIVSQFAIPYLTNKDVGYTRDAAGFVVLLFTIISLVGRFSMGFLSDMFNKKMVNAVTIGLLGVGLFIFWRIGVGTPYWVTVLFAITYGFGIAGIMPLRMPFMVEYFGTGNIGTIFGLTSMASTLGAIAAAPIAARIFDLQGTYKPAIIFLVGFSVVALVLMLAMPPPGKREVPAKVPEVAPGEPQG